MNIIKLKYHMVYKYDNYGVYCIKAYSLACNTITLPANHHGLSF